MPLHIDCLVPINEVRFVGTICGDSWSRWSPKGIAQVRFWLEVHEPGGPGRYLCVVETRLSADVDRYLAQFVNGIRLQVTARARPASRTGAGEADCGVHFIVHEWQIGLHQEMQAHPKPVRDGKMAAAGDNLELGIATS